MLRITLCPAKFVWVAAKKMPAFSSTPFWRGRRKVGQDESADKALAALLIEALEAIGGFLRRDLSEYAPALRNSGVLGRTMVARELHLKYKIFIDWGRTPAHLPA